MARVGVAGQRRVVDADAIRGVRLVGLTVTPKGDAEGQPLRLGQPSLRHGVETDLRGAYPEGAGISLRPGDVEKVSIAADVISDLELGTSKLLLPAPVVFTAPKVATVSLTDIPDRKDNFVNASFGMKAQLPGAIRAVANILFPLADAGLSPKFLWTFGFERTF